MQRQVREQRALSGPAKRDRPPVNNELERPKDFELHRWVVSPPSRFCNSPETASGEDVRMTRLLVFLAAAVLDRKSTRLNSSHVAISYAVFCLKKQTKIR